MDRKMLRRLIAIAESYASTGTSLSGVGGLPAGRVVEREMQAPELIDGAFDEDTDLLGIAHVGRNGDRPRRRMNASVADQKGLSTGIVPRGQPGYPFGNS
jgi:hypothetical protein